MRWLHVLGHLRPGGVELRLMWTLGALGEDFEHSIVSLDGSLDVLEAFPEVRERVRVIRAPKVQGTSTSKRLRWLGQLVGEEQPDALLTYGWGAFDAVLWSVLSRSRVPCFHHEDGFTAEEVAHMPRRRTLARRWTLPRIAATIVPSRTLASLASSTWRVPEERLVHVPNGIPRAEPGATIDLRGRFGILAGTPICVTVGRLASVKRVDRAIEAAARAGFALVVLGEGPERAQLESHARKVGSGTYFAGLQSDVRPYLRGADVYLSLSSSEQHPLAMLEAMDEGLPVVATDVGDVALSLPAGQERFVVPSVTPVENAAEGLRALRAHPELAESLGRTNVEHVNEHFRFEASVRKVRDAIVRRSGGACSTP